MPLPGLSLQKNEQAMSAFFMKAGQMEEIRKTSGRFNEAWTEEEKRSVNDQFVDGKRIEEIALAHERTVNAVRIKLVESGQIAPYLSRRGLPWSAEETERLGRFYSQAYSVAECAKLLGRITRETEDQLVAIGLIEPRPKKEPRSAQYPNAFQPWTEEEVQRLNDELALHRPVLAALKSIAARHGRSLGSIISRADKSGLCDNAGVK